MISPKLRTAFLACFFILQAAFPVCAEDVRYPANSGVLDIKSAPYNAVGDGVADDTAAFQAALTASANGNTIYIPNGIYRITDTLLWPGDGGVNITLQGQSQAGTILKLPDATSGFTNAGFPKVLLDGKGNHIPQRFGNSLRNLTVDTGNGNNGAIAVQYYANNVGVCRDVTIRGSGVIGLEMSHTRANGPNLVKNVTIDGFQYGIRTGYGMESLTFENITLRNQSVLGWLNENASRVVSGNTHVPASQVLSIRGLNASDLAVTAFKNPSGHVVMIDSTFASTSAASALSAIENGDSGKMLLRNIATTGYARVLRDGATNISGTGITEWTSDAPVSQFTSTGTTLNLPIQETPTVPDDDPSTWANIKTYGATNWNVGEGTRFDNDAPAIQAAIDSGATTVFIPAGSYRVLSQINVRGNVRRIIGVGGVSSVGAGNNAIGVPYQGIVWNIQAGTHPIVVLENMGTGYAVDMTGVENVSSRTVVLRDLIIQCPKFTGPGDIFVENVVSSYWEFNGQRIWARQINPERDGTHIINRGGTLWILGLKTEDYGYILDASNGAKTEILGGMIYSLDDATTGPMIRNVESQLSFSLTEYLGIYGKPYDVLVEETAQGIVNSLTRLNGTSVRHPAVWSQNNDGTTTSASGVVGSQFVLYCGPAVISSLTVKGNGAGIADNTVATSLTNHTSFGDVQTGASLTRTYTVHNAGTATVHFTGMPRIAIAGSNPGDFSVTQDLPASLASGEDATFQIRFTPAAFGTRAAVINFANDNTPDGSQSFAVSGNGAAPAPDIHFSAAGAAYSLLVGTNGNATFAIGNTGLGPLSATPVMPANYTFCTSDQLGGPAYEWIEIASGDNAGTRVTSIEGMDDARSQSLDLGFNFPFHGALFGKLRVHTNGFIELTNTTYTTNDYSPYGNSVLPDSSIPDNSILAYWDDLYFVNSNAEASTFSKAYVKTIGNDMAVITFSNVSFYSARTKRMTFQIVLKRSGEIRYNYQFLDNDLSCTVGVQKTASTAVQSLRDASGARIRSAFSMRFAPSVTFNGNTWLSAPTPSPLVVAASSNGTLTLPCNASGLTAGESYFTQVRLDSNDPNETPAYLPVTLHVLSSATPAPTGLTATSQSGPQIVLNWNDPSSSETGFRIERSLSAGSGFTTLASMPPNSIIHTDTTVAFGTTYYYRVVTLAAPDSAPSNVASASTPAATSIESWRLLHFGSAQNTGNGRDTLDFDADGVINLLEFALGADPLVNDAADFVPFPGTTTVSSSTYLTLTYPQPLSVLGITYHPECAGDLGGTWSPAILLGAGVEIYDFNTSQANFESIFNETSGWGALWNSTAGIAGSGGLNTDSNDRAAILPASLISFTTAGQKIEASIAFKARVTSGSANTAGGDGLRIGLNRVATPFLVAGGYLVTGLSRASANATISVLAADSRNDVPGTTSSTDTSVFTLVDNAWYRLDATFTYNGSNQFTIDSKLLSLGATGIGTPTLLDSYSVTRTGLTSLVGVPVYLGFQGKTAAGTGGVRTLDLFSYSSGLVTYRDIVPLDDATRRFMRLRVTNP